MEKLIPKCTFVGKRIIMNSEIQKYISQLNEAQQLPVLQKDGPMIVIAGAGSGKTRVLTVRIANLMSQGVDAFNILALTFTNKAAREMKKRIADIVGSNEAKNLWMGTFHSVFAKILRIESEKLGYPSNFTIYDTQDSVRLIGAIIKGDTDHYEYVCQYVTQGFSTIAATKLIPVIFGILTTQNEALAYERAAIDKMNKGQEFAKTAMEMIESFKSL